MKLNATLSMLCVLTGLILSGAVVSPAFATAYANADLVGAAPKTLVCELKDMTLDRVVDRGSDTLANPHVLFFVGQGDVMAMVRDVAQTEKGDRNLQLLLTYHTGVESSQAHAETNYNAVSAPLNSTLAEASLELGHNERRYQLSCLLN